MSEAPPELAIAGDLIDARVLEVLAAERERWRVVDARLDDAIAELVRMSGGGKRLRAAFCYWTWAGSHDAAGGDINDPSSPERLAAIDAGAAFELLQTFALIHDDVMDDADRRRGLPTIHTAAAERLEAEDLIGEPRRFGEGVAILIGDLSHVYADRLISGRSEQAQALWDELRIELNLGQYLDMRAAAEREPDRQTAQRVATFKTALYTIVRPMQVGAALGCAGASTELLDAIDTFGRPVGQAFQLRDDLLGVVGEKDRVGKPVGDDLREGKATELVAIASENATDSQQKVLATIGQRDLSDLAIVSIVDVLRETGAISAVEERIDKLVEAAAAAAHDLPFERGIRQTLVSLANYVAARTH